MRVVLIAGWNEAAKKIGTYADGRNGKDGLAAFGFDCTIFRHDPDATLREQVDGFAAFLERLKVREPEAFPVATIGYSAGGLVNRAFLKAYPERIGDVAATIQVAAPNGGLVTNYAIGTLRLARTPVRVLKDMDVASEFLRWLNGVGGTWVVDPDNPKKQRFRLDGTPWVMPPGHPFLHVLGRMPKYGLQSDGVVMIESATLGGAMPVATLDDDAANHLNVGAVFNPIATLARGFRHDDAAWPRVIDLCARFLRGEPLGEAGRAGRPA